MSRTALLKGPSTRSVMLSPSQKRIPDQEPGQDKTRLNDTKQTRHQLWRWCLRGDAIAQCYIRDVIQLKEHLNENRQDSDVIWWLGSVPCRNVKFVGMLTGVKTYEKRTIYTIDDGTGVIQCVQIHPQSTKDKQKLKPPSTNGSSIQQRSQLSQVSESPTSRYEVGDILRVTGRVEAWHDTRQIVINDIHLCWAKDEPEHWITTARLHKEYYSQPFVIPPLPPPVPQTPVKPSLDTAMVETPSTTSTVPTPSTAASSLSVCDTSESGPSRLRHPSRLRSKELIASTFKIYLKNYMDTLSDPSLSTYFSPSPFRDYLSSIEASPAKRLKQNADDEAETPKAKDRHMLFLQESDITPRPSQSNHKHSSTNFKFRTHTKGFTLSYLRRVPELADMAHKVVELEKKRRYREQRQKQRDAARTGNEITLPKQPLEEPTSRKAKRLYMWALRELHREGSIILHEDDAPVWEFPELSKMGEGIWRTAKRDEKSAGLDTGNTTVMSTLCSLTSSTVDESRSHWDPGELSDPPVQEESYVPLTAAMLMGPVMDAIKGFMIRKAHTKRSTVQKSTGSFHDKGSTVGPTAEDLREYLKKVDARWENVGEYTIKDALELLKKEEKVYRIGNGRWELSI